METRTLLSILVVILAVASGGVFLYLLFAPRQTGNIRALMGNSGSRGLSTPSEERQRMQNDPTGKEFERLKQQTRRRYKKKAKVSLQEKFFFAGIFSDKEKRDFNRLRILAPLIAAPLGAWAVISIGLGPEIVLLGGIMGLLLGLQLPISVLDRKIQRRGEEILYYLPLVIEQVAIGVSSSLDVGPCLQRVVSMADERDTHNVVTELLRHVYFYVKSGVSLEDALMEVGKLSGHTELKHAFMSLSQVARHGGEITRQLQELADAVSAQRETKIGSKIKKLELEATGPVALVFLGFLVILLIGFGLQVKGAFE